MSGVGAGERLALEAQALRGVEALLRLAGEDPAREGIRETPARVVKAFLEMTSGGQEDPAVILSKTFDRDGYDEMVVKRGIPFASLCEHHLLPFTGTVDVGYIPGARVVGLSKLSRLVDCYARRVQIQERMTVQIAEAILAHLAPVGVGVIVRASHACVSCRGVGKSGTEMVTSTLRGAFHEAATRDEFMRLAGI